MMQLFTNSFSLYDKASVYELSSFEESMNDPLKPTVTASSSFSLSSNKMAFTVKKRSELPLTLSFPMGSV